MMRYPTAILISLTLLFTSTAFGQSTEQRLNRIERLLNSRTLVDMHSELERLRREVNDLRGRLEVQDHTIQQLQRQQRSELGELSSRVQSLESGSPNAVSTVVATEPQTTTPATRTLQPSGQPNTGAQTNTNSPEGERGEYQAAFNLLKAGKYSGAVTAFGNFLGRYPDGQFSDNAQYWLGETFYVTRQFSAAMTEFQRLLDGYPNSQKTSHAMLKIGYIQDELGRNAEAQQTLESLISQFPDSTAAGLARKRLQQ